jgi:lipopolysaccharide biosynthesis regulator YciM
LNITCGRDFDKARELHGKAEELQPTHHWVTWMRGFIAAEAGDRETALLVVRRIEASSIETMGSFHNEIGFIYYPLGDLDSYFDHINQALDLHALKFIYPMYCPLFENGRADPGYKAMLEKIKGMFWPEEK